jgi:hypothetical protein
MHNDTAVLARPPSLPAASVPPRVDLYRGIHKALRHMLGDTLARVGRIDLDDELDLREALAQLDDLLAVLRQHLRVENDVVHAAIEARRPAATTRTAADHVAHLATIADLEAEAHSLRVAAPPRRDLPGQRLYRHLAEFVAENLAHMQLEETVNNALLWTLYDDGELMALHEALVAATGERERAIVVRWMARSLSSRELAAASLQARDTLPAAVFDAMLERIRRELDMRRDARLLLALRLPATGFADA